MTQELTGAQRYGLRLAIEGIKSRVVQELSVLQISTDSRTEPIQIALGVIELLEQNPHAVLALIPKGTTT